MNVFSTVNFIKSKYISSIFNETLTVQMRCAVGNRFWAHRTKRTQNCHICSGSYDYMWKCYLGYLGLNYITKVNFTCFFFHLRVDPWTTQDELHRSFVCLFLNSKYCSVTQSLAGRICTDTEEAWIRGLIIKFIHRFSPVRSFSTPTPCCSRINYILLQ